MATALTGSSFNYGFGAHTDWEWIGGRGRRADACQADHACCCRVSARSHDLKHAYELGVRSVRVATHCTEADIAMQHIEAARAISGMDVAGFLMMSHMTDAGGAGGAGQADGESMARIASM